jgi:hypothetical protein
MGSMIRSAAGSRLAVSDMFLRGRPRIAPFAKPTGRRPMQLSPTIFKAYDIRGIVPHHAHEDVAEALGRAFGTAARPKARRRWPSAATAACRARAVSAR